MTRGRELHKRRQAALTVCDRVPREAVPEVLDMLGLIPLTPPDYRGSAWFDSGLDGGQAAHRKKIADRLDDAAGAA